MAQEIERKYRVTSDAWRAIAPAGTRYQQGYLSTDVGRTVRVRTAGQQGWLTVKGAPVGISRAEFEYAIPLAEAQMMLETLCLRPLIEKTRYRIPYAGLVWEIDEFTGDNQGLVVAEVELSEEHQAIQRPEWVGPEVTHDARYTNAQLVHHPFSAWER
jgi:CYTH domain-containing protein